MSVRAALLWLGLAVASCKPAPEPALRPQAAPPRAEVKFVAPEVGSLKFATTPHLAPERLKKLYEPFAAYMTRALGIRIDVVITQSYEEVGELLERGEIDLAGFSPFAYLLARTRLPAMQPVVSHLSEGSATSAVYVFVDARSDVRSVDELQGKSFAFVDPASTSGYLYPMKHFLDRGIDPKIFFSRTAFLGNHDEVLKAVLDGRFDAGATYSGALADLQRSDGVDPLSFRIIGKLPRTPHNIICAREGLSPTVVAELRRVLLGLSVKTAEGRTALRPLGANGFVLPDEAIYRPVEEAYRTLLKRGLL